MFWCFGCIGDDFANLADFFLGIEETRKRRNQRHIALNPNCPADVLSPSVNGSTISIETDGLSPFRPLSAVTALASLDGGAAVSSTMTKSEKNSEILIMAISGYYDYMGSTFS